MKFNTPVTITDIEMIEGSTSYALPIGRRMLVSVRPCAPEFEGKTFLGIYIGDIAQSIGGGTEESTLKLHFSMLCPAIFVPELNRVIFGYESWWGPIKSEDDLRQITDEDINSIWYVQALKQIAEQSEGTE